MQEKQLFEYAVLRLVPRVEREEFLNIGVILYCREARFLQCLYALDEQRLTAFCPQIDVIEIQEYLSSFERICRGESRGGVISGLDAASRFRWLTATRSTVLQTSRVHPGFSTEAAETLQHLYARLVL